MMSFWYLVSLIFNYGVFHNVNVIPEVLTFNSYISVIQLQHSTLHFYMLNLKRAHKFGYLKGLIKFQRKYSRKSFI